MNYLFTSESVSEGHPDKVAIKFPTPCSTNFSLTTPNRKSLAKHW